MENYMATLSQGYAFIPNSVLYNKDLSATAKLLYACISSHCAKTGKCFANNDYLAEKMGLKIRAVQVLIKELIDNKCIIAEFNDQKNKRLLSLQGGVQNFAGGGAKKDTHNNINIKTVSKDTVTSSSEKNLLLSLNSKTGRNFRVLPRGAKKLLKTFTLDEINKALANLMTDTWHKERIGTLSSDYLLRPSTIDKFLSYKPHNEPEVIF